MMSSFPLVSFLITLMLASRVCTHGENRVDDTDGNPLRTTAQYLILPLSPRSNGGGLLPVPVKLQPLCPLGISQSSVKALTGLPVSFSYPYAIMDTYVNEMEAINIEFKSDAWPGCEEFSKYWEVDESSSASEEPAVLVGGKSTERNSWFRIERKEPFYGGVAYKLTTLTGTIGTVPGPLGQAPQLVLTNDDCETSLIHRFMIVHGDTPATTSRQEKLGLRMFPFY
ncbi:trypsin inhibitor B precursor [Brassica rapa]|uniref:Drought-induced protein n=1 Tax=Brassica campestris TaxID=3711 RepID=Q42436_BRACM|nr:trypsin inhibitor B precursor [Brassica rapa]AAA33012.1 drought-induced protein [Brassica rapa]CAA81031.1 putative drought induced protein [Brassica rapa]